LESSRNLLLVVICLLGNTLFDSMNTSTSIAYLLLLSLHGSSDDFLVPCLSVECILQVLYKSITGLVMELNGKLSRQIRGIWQLGVLENVLIQVNHIWRVSAMIYHIALNERSFQHSSTSLIVRTNIEHRDLKSSILLENDDPMCC